jgi:hypothetical protein
MFAEDAPSAIAVRPDSESLPQSIGLTKSVRPAQRLLSTIHLMASEDPSALMPGADIGGGGPPGSAASGLGRTSRTEPTRTQRRLSALKPGSIAAY